MNSSVPQSVLEHRQRIDRAIARYTARHMSNTKWRKLFTVLADFPIYRLAWRFVDSDAPLTTHYAPSVSDLLDDGIGVAGGQVLLQPVTYAPGQLWLPLAVPVLPAFQPFWRTVSQQIHPNPPLPPAQLGLSNTHRHALFVLLADRRLPGKTRQIRIESNQTASVTLDRDSGATLVETYEIRSPSGRWGRQQFTTAIPPQPLYDLSVYEEILQSIAIDRTGKSPSPIEDVNYMPKSVGWLQLPAGAQLPPTSAMDVLREAKQVNNPGGVRQMDVKQFNDKSQPDPVESLLEESKAASRKGSQR